jgi:hypothetical protein
MVTGGQSLKKAHNLICCGAGALCVGGAADICLPFWIMMFAAVQLPLSQFPNFNFISAVSGATAVMSLTYSLIAFSLSAAKGATDASVDYAPRAPTTAGKVFGVLNALGAVAFAYMGHNVVLEI